MLEYIWQSFLWTIVSIILMFVIILIIMIIATIINFIRTVYKEHSITKSIHSSFHFMINLMREHAYFINIIILCSEVLFLALIILNMIANGI